MTAIAVNRWRTHYRTAAPLSARQIDAWNAGLASIDAATELDAVVAHDEWICIRRLILQGRWSSGADSFHTQTTWRESLSASIREVLRDPPAGMVVRYRDKRDAVADMLYRAAAGDLRRVWAWRRMGLLPDASGGVPSDQEVLRSALLILIAESRSIWPVLARMLAAEAATGAFTAVISGICEDDWNALLATCPQTRVLQRHAADTGRRRGATALVFPACPLLDALRAWIAGHKWLARQYRNVLAVLVATAAGHAPQDQNAEANDVLDAAIAVVERHAGIAVRQVGTDTRRKHGLGIDAAEAAAAISKPSAPRAPDRRRGDVPEIVPEGNAETPDMVGAREDRKRPELPEAPPLPQSEQRVFTDWAGLVFLVHLIPQSNLLESVRVLASSQAMPDDSVTRVLRTIAVAHFGVPQDEAAIRALCGARAPADDQGQIDRQGLDRVAAEAAASLRTLLAVRVPELAHEHGEALVAHVCRRPGWISFEPGWIEVHMEARLADVRLRRAALDLDPGYVPWLACVVRFVYE